MPSLQEQGICTICKKAYVFCFCDYDEEDEVWTDEDEAALEEFEDERRRKLAERNEY